MRSFTYRMISSSLGLHKHWFEGLEFVTHTYQKGKTVWLSTTVKTFVYLTRSYASPRGCTWPSTKQLQLYLRGCYDPKIDKRQIFSCNCVISSHIIKCNASFESSLCINIISLPLKEGTWWRHWWHLIAYFSSIAPQLSLCYMYQTLWPQIQHTLHQHWSNRRHSVLQSRCHHLRTRGRIEKFARLGIPKCLRQWIG